MLNRIKAEPVAFIGALQVIFLAVLALASAFDWWEWSEDQQTAVLAVWGAVTAGLTYLLRGAVSPVPK